jgi:hypothetical protein
VIRRIALVLLVVGALLVALVFAAGLGVFGRTDGAGEIRGAARPAEVVRQIAQADRDAASGIGVTGPKQILFGDFHVHTTLSFDAFVTSLPALGGEGAHPPADACDFARYCSALDFWSINDHAEALSTEAWQSTVESIRACNERSGDPANPDSVAFLGWEWTQVGNTPADHYGHKNVVLAGLADDEIPARPIVAGGRVLQIRMSPPRPFVRGLLALLGGGRMHDLAAYFTELSGQPFCPDDVNTRELPPDCLEVAETPDVLFRKLDEWGFDSIVIPHGTTWGFYTPAGSTWDKQLAGNLNDPKRQTLFEIYSGHGDSEVYRSWRAVEFGPEGEVFCPEPRPEYEPACFRAGEIIRERCLAEGTAAEECDARAQETRELAAQAGVAGHLVVQGERPADWLDAGQCRDCREPAFNYRPGGSVQYVLALGDFEDDPQNPRRFRMGFISSSDNHTARPGTGYKEVKREGFTESNNRRNLSSSRVADALRPAPEEPSATPRFFDPNDNSFTGFQLTESERQSSFFLTGGLVAVHAEGRDRGAIWSAVKRREVYGTTGPRILLWFDLLNSPGSTGRTLPMGGEVAMSEAPIFQIRAVGSFEQKPGCPDYATEALSPEAIESLCLGECYNPSDERRRITRIEVVRIRPQIAEGEDVAQLIDDPWVSIECEPSREGCAATVVDPDFSGEGRDTVYYARVFEEPAPAVNAAGANCEVDTEGRCVKALLCTGEGDCLSEHEPRAWSSPIFVDFAPAG